jgi:multidrug efflux system outer membrane protein
MFRGIAILTIAFPCLASMAACNMAPRYSQPEAPVSAPCPAGPAYKDVLGEPADKAAADTPWQEFFVTPHLFVRKIETQRAKHPHLSESPHPLSKRPAIAVDQADLVI